MSVVVRLGRGLKTTCRQGTRDRFSGVSSTVLLFSYTFLSRSWYVEGMNRWTWGLLSSFLYLVS